MRKIFFCLAVLKSSMLAAQNPAPVFRSLNLNSTNEIEIRYKILNDSLKGFFNINETFEGKVKLVNAKCVFPYKFANNILQISSPKLVMHEEFIFNFKTFEEDVSVSGNCNIENYPNSPVLLIFEKLNYKLKKEEPVVVVPVKVIPVEVNLPPGKKIVRDTLGDGVRFRIQISAASAKMDKVKLKILTGLTFEVYEDLIDNYYKYTIGNEPTFSQAQVILNKLAVNNFKKPFIVAYINGKRVTVQQAMAEIKAQE